MSEYTSISVAGYELDGVLAVVAQRLERVERASAFSELRLVLERWSAEPPDTDRIYTLDLLGHSIGPSRLLELGQSVVDMDDPTIVVQAAALARSGLLKRCCIGAVRLLGCSTAVEVGGQRTMHRLSRVLGVPVIGTSGMLLPSHYNAHGFDPIFGQILIDTRDLASRPEAVKWAAM